MLSFLIFLQLFISTVLASNGSVEPRIQDSRAINTSFASEEIEATEATEIIDAADAADAAAEAEARRRIWHPRVGARFQIILSATIDLHEEVPLVPKDVGIFDIDLFDTEKASIDALKRMGKKVICYFSAGTTEDWRADFKEFNATDQGANLPMWPGERWLDVRNTGVHNIMKKRIKYASQQGCDAIDPDNMDGYSNEKGGGFKKPLTQRDAIRYVRILSREAHKYNMAIGLKNAEEIVSRVTRDVQFAVNEECGMESLNRCAAYRSFLSPRSRNPFTTGKPVFHIEYVQHKPIKQQQTTGLENPQTATAWEISNVAFRNMSSDALRKRLCLDRDRSMGPKLSTVIKAMTLDGWVMHCDGRAVVTRTKQNQRQLEQEARQKEGFGFGRTASLDDPNYLAILAEPNAPIDWEAEAELEASLDRELADHVEPTGPKKGAAKDKRPSQKWLESNPGASIPESGKFDT